MNITLDNENVRALAANAIMGALDQVSRDTLIQSAIKSLLEPTTSSYGVKGPSNLEQAFRFSLGDVAKQITTQMLQEPETKAQVEAVVRTAVLKVLSSADFTDRLSKALASAFFSRD